MATGVPASPFIVFGKPDIGDQEKTAVLDVLDSGWLSTGRQVTWFEEAFRDFMGGGFPVAVSSCTDALILSLIASGVGPGDEVITTPLTFAATANAIVGVGARPVFVDVDDDGQIDPANIKKAVTSRTKAIVPVHYTGAPCDILQIMSIAKVAGAHVIEDAAHAFGGFHSDTTRRIGSHGDYACFSFYPTKNVTCGEGGVVFVQDERKAELIRCLSMQGLNTGAHERYAGPAKTYRVLLPGRKANMSDIHAAIGAVQIKRWPELHARRQIVWTAYEHAFGAKQPGHSQHLFTIQDMQRDALRSFLFKRGIGTGVHFNPLHIEPGYAFLGYKVGQFPNAERIGFNTVSLPVSSTMTLSDAARVIEAVTEFRHTGRA